MKKRRKILLSLFVSMSILLTGIAGCGSNTSATQQETTQDTTQDTTQAGTDTTASDKTVTENYEMIEVSYDEADLDATWDENAATKITCSDTQVTIDGDGVTEANGIITISTAGTYVFSGTLADGQICVEAGNEDTVHIVLNGITISSSTSAAINGVQSEKIILTLADGTTNEVSDASEYQYPDTDTDEPNAAVFSKDDIAINGSGSLKVTGNYQDGIRSKDDLIIVSGTLDVTAKEDGIKGKDSIVVKDGTITVDAGQDGMKSNNDTATDKGYVVLEGGTYTIVSGNDGIQAETVLQVTGGTYDIKTGDGSETASQNRQESLPGNGGGQMQTLPSDGDGQMQTPPSDSDGQMQTPPSDSNGQMQTPPSDSNGQMQTPPDMNQDTPQSGDTSSDTTTSDTTTSDATTSDAAASEDTSTDTSADSSQNSGTDSDTAQDSAAAETTASTSQKGLKGSAAVFITGGNITIDSVDDAIHSNGDVTVTDGELNLSTGDDGIHADSNLTINGGTIDITRSYEGLEGLTIDINGGTTHLVASDDGVNAAGGNDSSGNQFGSDAFAANEDAYIRITDGYLYVDASGDGLDSNGNLYIDGGTILVNGPTSGGDGALDYDGTAEITGGTIIAAGSAGMAQGFSESSTQNSMLVYYSEVQSANTLLNLSDADGNTIVSFAPSKDYQTVVISTPDLKSDTTYALSSGGTAAGDAADGYYGTQAYTNGTKLYDITVEGSVTTGGDATVSQNNRGESGGSGGKGGGMGERPSGDSNGQGGGSPNQSDSTDQSNSTDQSEQNTGI